MINFQLYNVAPKIPEELSFLERLSYNVWWSWHPEATELFLRINPNLWRQVGGNSRKFLGMVPQARLEELAKDKAYLRQLKRVEQEFERDCSKNPDRSTRHIAYFSMEYGIHESIRLYSGGLGVLAGDHLKAASDMGLPIVGVGLLYRQGYFRQYLDRNGWQIERYPDNEIHNMPLTRALDLHGNEVFVKLPLLDRELVASVWTMMVGNIPLILLDTELPQNPPEFREITGRLYGGDRRMRLEQELLLGIGGYMALIKMGFEPEVCHMNEGHAAFLSLARIQHLVQDKKMDPDTALEVVWRSNIFTTHTPVPAGNEVFNIDLVRPYLESLLKDTGLDVNRVLNWGIPVDNRDKSHEICMTILGMRLANYSNGVSKLHGEVARNMWRHLWPGRAMDEIPIKHVTNGVHISTWVAPRKRAIFDRYLSIDWSLNPNTRKLRQYVESIPDEELWMAHELCRHSMIRSARSRLQQRMKCRSLDCSTIYQAKNFLDPDILTIGFARRFATYKRGTLLLRNAERLKLLLSDQERPIQLIFAGKAHPADEAGKSLIQQLIQFCEQPGVRSRIVFLEDYDMSLAREMISGVDVWLNTPRRPQEASGTSGMKAAVNGVLNCSILDGWWAEAYSHKCGFAIVGDENYEDPEDCDNFESHVLFNLLERDIIPTFYDRSEGDLPHRWIRMMKESIIMALGNFSSMRMIQQYNYKFYAPAVERYEQLTAENATAAKKLVKCKNRLKDNYASIKIEYPKVDSELVDVHVGDTFNVSARVFLNELKPEDVDIQVYYGPVNTHNEIIHSYTANMELAEDLGNGHYMYKYQLHCAQSGRFGLTARITPTGRDWRNSMPGFICWAD
ncbi:alpha-glucan family phosphorylase [Lentisphaerota bacterium ZTH]|nr:alpha-glucan family phosphorylase [Lentisphaerota bacterium]WET07398.1 alpha-glucan family phosphorylase [Lentisphaerota bacterium ZTH]